MTTTLLSSHIISTGSSSVVHYCPCNGTEIVKTELEINAEKMREVMKNKIDLLSKIHHRATHSSDAYWASFILTSMAISLIVSVLASKMWKDSEYFITYTHCQPTVYPQYSSKSEIYVKDMLISKARTALKTGGEDTVDSAPSSTVYHKLLSQYSHSTPFEDSSGESSSDEGLSPNEEEGYMYYYDSKREEWRVGLKPVNESRSFWSKLWTKNYRRDRVSYQKITSEVELPHSSDSDPH